MDDGGQYAGIGVGVEGLAGVGEDDLAVSQRDNGLVQRIEQGGDDIGVVILRIGYAHGALIGSRLRFGHPAAASKVLATDGTESTDIRVFRAIRG